MGSTKVDMNYEAQMWGLYDEETNGESERDRERRDEEQQRNQSQLEPSEKVFFFYFEQIETYVYGICYGGKKLIQSLYQKGKVTDKLQFRYLFSNYTRITHMKLAFEPLEYRSII